MINQYSNAKKLHQKSENLQNISLEKEKIIKEIGLSLEDLNIHDLNGIYEILSEHQNEIKTKEEILINLEKMSHELLVKFNLFIKEKIKKNKE